MSYPPPPYRPQPYQPGQPYRSAEIVVTRKTLHPAETIMHLILTFCTGGLWGFVWLGRLASRRRYTAWR